MTAGHRRESNPSSLPGPGWPAPTRLLAASLQAVTGLCPRAGHEAALYCILVRCLPFRVSHSLTPGQCFGGHLPNTLLALGLSPQGQLPRKPKSKELLPPDASKKHSDVSPSNSRKHSLLPLNLPFLQQQTSRGKKTISTPRLLPAGIPSAGHPRGLRHPSPSPADLTALTLSVLSGSSTAEAKPRPLAGPRSKTGKLLS